MTVTDEQLSAYLDGELPEDDARAIDDALYVDATPTTEVAFS